MLVTICRLYDSYADASRVIVALEAVGVAPSETSLISNNADNAHATETANAAPARKDTLCIAAYGFLISETETIPPSEPRRAAIFPQLAVPDGYRPRGAAIAA
jgi:hypothetical protein